MAIGESKYVNTMIRMIGDKREDIDNYCESVLDREYAIKSSEEIEIPSLSREDIDSVREYSGYNFKHINAALRDNWNYEVNGNISNKNEYIARGRRLEEIIGNNPSYMGNFRTYRGATLSSFSEYGITSIDELKNMEGKFMFDRGFTSTSISEDKCFYDRDNELGKNYNVKIEYLIPEEFGDGIYLGNSVLSYTPGQDEYLINRANMSKVIGVSVDSQNNKATMMVVMIPKHIYDMSYGNNVGRSK